MQPELTIFDLSTGGRRAATQEDIDAMEQFIMALSVRPEMELRTNDHIKPTDDLRFALAIYPNRMRSDGVFVAEAKEVKPYEGITAMNGDPVYPSFPDTAYRIGIQLPNAFAEELVKRWNSYNGQA